MAALADKPAALAAATNSSNLSFERAATTTSAPNSAKAAAQPSPIPDDAPVISARRPSRRKAGVLGSSIFLNFLNVIYRAGCNL